MQVVKETTVTLTMTKHEARRLAELLECVVDHEQSYTFIPHMHVETAKEFMRTMSLNNVTSKELK